MNDLEDSESRVVSPTGLYHPQLHGAHDMVTLRQAPSTLTPSDVPRVFYCCPLLTAKLRIAHIKIGMHKHPSGGKSGQQAVNLNVPTWIMQHPRARSRCKQVDVGLIAEQRAGHAC